MNLMVSENAPHIWGVVFNRILRKNNVPLQTRRRFSITFSCLVFALLAFQNPALFVPAAHAAGTQTFQYQPSLSLGDTFSGGLWARLNSVVNSTAIIDPLKNPNAIHLPVLSAPSPQPDPPNLFTNNFRVTGNSGLFPLEDEPSIAVTNQSGHVLMVVGANSLSTGLMPAYVSRDQGSTWLGPSYLQLSRANDSFTSDPGLAVDRTGTFYYSFLSIGNTFTPFGSRTGQDDLVVATSTDGGNWTNHVAVERRTFVYNSTINGELYDKPYISVGPNPSNSLTDAIYVTYTDFVDYYNNKCTSYCYGYQENSTIMQAHSTDGGSTWSTPRAVSPTVTISSANFGPTAGRLVQGSMPAVDPRNGWLYVSYYDTNSSGWLTGNATVMIAKSTDGGATFSKPVLAGLIPQQVTYYSTSCGIGFCGPGFRWWSTMFPSMDIAQDGTVYISYGAKQSRGTADPADIFLVASTNGGVSWTKPVKVNDDSSQNGAFFSWLKVSSDGVVHIIWGDRRYDPAQIGYDIFYAQATNLGQTIGTNIRVTDIGTDPINTVSFVGDYFNLAVSGGQVYPVWTDGRRAVRPLGQYLLTGETDIFMARLGSRATATLSVGQGAPAGYYAPVTVTGTGLPRDSYFSLKMNNIALNSPTYTYPLFFSDPTGNLNTGITPNANYYGSYPIELQEYLDGIPIANSSMYIVDSRGLQVVVAGPSTVHPGDTFTWDIQLITPSGTLNPQGYSSTISVKAQLLYPNGTIRDITSSAVSTSPTSYTLTTKLSTDAPMGSYVLTITGSQTGPTVQSNGIGTASFAVDPNSPQNSSSLPQDNSLMFGLIAGGIGVIGAVAGATVIFLSTRRKPSPATIPSP